VLEQAAWGSAWDLRCRRGVWRRGVGRSGCTRLLVRHKQDDATDGCRTPEHTANPPLVLALRLLLNASTNLQKNVSLFGTTLRVGQTVCDDRKRLVVAPRLEMFREVPLGEDTLCIALV
jgi:hypothetical protein